MCFWFAHSILSWFIMRKRGWKSTCFADVPLLLLPALNWLCSSSPQPGTPFCNPQQSPLTSTSFADFSVTRPQRRGYLASGIIYSTAGQFLSVSLKNGQQEEAFNISIWNLREFTCDCMLVTLDNALGTSHVKIWLWRQNFLFLDFLRLPWCCALSFWNTNVI